MPGPSYTQIDLAFLSFIFSLILQYKQMCWLSNKHIPWWQTIKSGLRLSFFSLLSGVSLKGSVYSVSSASLIPPHLSDVGLGGTVSVNFCNSRKHQSDIHIHFTDFTDWAAVLKWERSQSLNLSHWLSLFHYWHNIYTTDTTECKTMSVIQERLSENVSLYLNNITPTPLYDSWLFMLPSTMAIWNNYKHFWFWIRLNKPDLNEHNPTISLILSIINTNFFVCWSMSLSAYLYTLNVYC